MCGIRIESTMFYGAKPETFRQAEKLRMNMTNAEKVLWNRLKKKQLGIRFKPQHPIDIFIADFYCHKAKLVIELDGESHKTRKEYDIGRTREIEKYGIKVMRFKNNEVLDNVEKVVEIIRKCINSITHLSIT